jgi:spermidine synthase
VSQEALPVRAGPPAPPLVNQAVAAGAGLAYALAYLWAGYDAPWVAINAPSPTLIEGVLHLLTLPLLLWALQRAWSSTILPRLPDAAAATRFARAEPRIHAIWLVAAALLPLEEASIALTLATLGLHLLLLAAVSASALGAAGRRELARSEQYLAGLFLLSGFAALIYQIVWQRVLFTEFGVNSESVTAIVSVFMFGLGVGALAGGWLQERFPRHLLHIFVAIEACIGVYGALALFLIHVVSPASEPTMAGLVMRVYAVLAFPTLLMGATLPVLIAHLQKSFRDIGRTVSLLYALNTFGSAIAAFVTVTVLFVLGGLRASITVAVLCNLGTAWLVLRASRNLPAQPAAAAAPPLAPAAPAGASWTLAWPLAVLALAAVGFVSLSAEILWFRLVSFMTANRPEVFGILLAVYLAGIGWGSLRAQHAARDDRATRSRLVRDLLCAALAIWITLPLTSWIAAIANTPVAVAVAYGAAGLVAFWCGGLFPTLIELGTRDRTSASAQRVAWLYFANIAGAALGPLMTGFILLDRFPLDVNMAVLAVLAIALALALAGAGRAAPILRRRHWIGVAAAVIAATLLHHSVFDGSLERLLYADQDAAAFRRVEQDRSGIITVEAAATDIMYGHGIYDGRYNIDPAVNSNLITRAYLGLALHPAPRRVLEIGLSTGSWTRVASSYAPVREMVVVEIGRAYPKLIPDYPQIAPILSDPRIRIVLDDGRRWLKNHPGEQFDFILMNTSFPWRSNMTNLLSQEFLALARQHLRPGGVLYYNSLSSPHVRYTAAHVFKHVTTYLSFVAASDSPLDVAPDERRARLLRFVGSDGRPVFAQGPAHAKQLEELVAAPLPDLAAGLLARDDLWLITDDNMATEFKVRH